MSNERIGGRRVWDPVDDARFILCVSSTRGVRGVLGSKAERIHEGKRGDKSRGEGKRRGRYLQPEAIM